MDSIAISMNSYLNVCQMSSEDFLKLTETRQDVQLLINSANGWAFKNDLEPPRLSDTSIVIAIQYSGLYAGFIQFYAFPFVKELYLSWIYVMQDYRRIGLASKLIKELQLFLCKLNDYEQISSYVLNNNYISQDLHTKCGFALGRPMCFSPHENPERFLGMVWRKQ